MSVIFHIVDQQMYNHNFANTAKWVSGRRRQGASWSTGVDARRVSGAELTLIIIIGPQSLVKLKL